MEPSLNDLVQELTEKHHCHTLILYGSRARGEETPESDYDLLGFRETGADIWDARLWNGKYLDVFIYPESKINSTPEEFFRLRGGRILKQKDQLGERLLSDIEKAYQEGPKPRAPDQLEGQRVWARKTLARIKRGDIEGNYRRASLLVNLVEDYFVLRGKWFLGPRLSLDWLKKNDTETYQAFQAALALGAQVREIEILVGRVIGE